MATNMAAVAGQNSEQLSNNFEVPKFFRVGLQLQEPIKLQLPMRDHIFIFLKKFISAVHIIFISKQTSYLHLTVKLGV